MLPATLNLYKSAPFEWNVNRAVGIVEEVQTLSERAKMLLNVYISYLIYLLSHVSNLVVV
jgi:hypothetical protein